MTENLKTFTKFGEYKWIVFILDYFAIIAIIQSGKIIAKTRDFANSVAINQSFNFVDGVARDKRRIGGIHGARRDSCEA